MPIGLRNQRGRPPAPGVEDREWRRVSAAPGPPLDTYEQLHLVYEPGRGMWIRYGEVWDARQTLFDDR
jgi:hypothetical protein